MSQAVRHALIDDDAYEAQQEIAAMCKREIEIINRRFGQYIRHQLALELRVRRNQNGRLPNGVSS